MKVKIGSKIYDAEKEPIMIILSNSDKENIRHMGASMTKYISFPEGTPREEINKFAETNSVCERCNGAGYTVEVEPECCGNYEPNGCCNNPHPKQVQAICECAAPITI